MSDTTPSAPLRVAGLRGRKPPLAPADRFPLRWVHEYQEGVAEPAALPPEGDVTSGVTDWGMFGNGPDPTLTANDGQPVGDCGPAAFFHNRMAVALAHKVEPEAALPLCGFTADQVVDLYLTYTGGQDVGVVGALFLQWLYKQGLILAFAPVDVLSRDKVNQAVLDFDGVLLGVQLTDNADDLFTAGKPWALDGEQPDPEDGHFIVKAGFTPQLDKDLSWGAVQFAEVSWTETCAEEAWAIITPENAHLVDLDALVADIEALGGETAPEPGQVPDPESERGVITPVEPEQIEEAVGTGPHPTSAQELAVGAPVDAEGRPIGVPWG